jgi:hypothetical protein
MVGPRRVFLGWDRPPLPRVAQWLLEHSGPDLGHMAVVVSGQRAGRRLLARLVRLATSRDGGRGFVPPLVVTPGSLPELLYEPRLRQPTRSERLLAWTTAIENEQERVGGAGDFGSVLARARDICRVQDELAAEGLRLADVPGSALHLLEEDELERWRSLASQEAHVDESLERRGSCERGRARLEALRGGGLAPRVSEVALCAVAETGRLTVEMLEASRLVCTCLVAAPAGTAESFDRWGRVLAESWCGMRSAAFGAGLEVHDRPADQAAAVAERAAATVAAGGEVVIGAGAPELARPIERAVVRRGVPCHSALGRPLADSEPWPLLRALADFVDRRRFRDFASLLRHPELEAALVAGLDAPAAESASPQIREALAAGDLLTLTDIYTTRTCLAQVGGEWPGDAVCASVLRRSVERLWELLSVRGADAAAERRPLALQVASLRGLLEAVFGDARFEQDRPDELVLARSLEELGRCVAELDRSAEGGGPLMTLGEALHLLEACAPAEAAPVLGGGVELVGWLELPLDEADEALVVGLNEGFLPQAPPMDPFLTPPLRRELSLPGETERLGRDLYYLDLLRSSRSLRLYASRRHEDDEPLAPSRLLLACDAKQRARVLLDFYGAEPSPRIVARAGAGAGLVAPPAGGYRPDRLRVTAFRDYLQCPYRFWLRHVRGARRLGDLAGELEPGEFGSLIHDVLGGFAASPVASSARAGEIASCLQDLLARFARERFGGRPRVAVALQIEQANRRLSELARWQAEQVRDGWRLVPERAEARLEAELWVDDEPVRIVGRLDRLDRHPERGYRLVDYKTAERPRSPERVHRDSKTGEWRDLQLPLYEWMLRQDGIEGDLELAFVNLAPNLRGDSLTSAKWTPAELEDAVEKARETVRAVRRGIFWPPGPPPGFDDGLADLAGDRLWNREALIEAAS